MIKSQWFIGIVSLLGLFRMESCIKPASYKGIKDIKVTNYSPFNFSMTGKAQYYNPNIIGCQVTDVTIDVYLEGTKINTVKNLQTNIKVGAKSDFEIPLSFSIKPEGGVFSNLKNSYKLLTNQKMKIYYNGYVTLKFLFFTHKVKMEATEEHTLSEFMK